MNDISIYKLKSDNSITATPPTKALSGLEKLAQRVFISLLSEDGYFLGMAGGSNSVGDLDSILPLETSRVVEELEQVDPDAPEDEVLDSLVLHWGERSSLTSKTLIADITALSGGQIYETINI